MYDQFCGVLLGVGRRCGAVVGVGPAEGWLGRRHCKSMQWQPGYGWSRAAGRLFGARRQLAVTVFMGRGIVCRHCR
ncbi:unnamed protein product [Urochloa humidicola]